MGQRSVEVPLRFQAIPSNVGTTAKGSRLIVRNPSSRRGELYWALFRWTSDDRLERVLSEQVGTPLMLGHSLTESVLVFGEGWTVEESAIRASISPSITVSEAPESSMKPSAVSIGQRGLERLRRGEYAGVGISPLYVQRTAAELKYEESGGISPVALRQARVARKVNARQGAQKSRPAIREK